ncbi:hypothetical protein AVEN_77857-1 [Araneus ventricosus]|uniref:Uncharacterized protein n=1 Tax=Araneus ventricosus TaxID=182803 RepID=A0A4Y2Q7B8_ARAVE|nr:hypothetical protein AVEN_77857-1 [Araneus ventricosus]
MDQGVLHSELRESELCLSLCNSDSEGNSDYPENSVNTLDIPNATTNNEKRNRRLRYGFATALMEFPVYTYGGKVGGSTNNVKEQREKIYYVGEENKS